MKKIIIVIAGLMACFGAVAGYGDEKAVEVKSGDGKNGMQNTQNRLSDKQLKTIFDDLDKTFAKPSTPAIPYKIEEAIYFLRNRGEGDNVIPYLKNYIDSRNQEQRSFAIRLLIEIGSDSTLSIICKKFWELYNKKDNLDKIAIGDEFSPYSVLHSLHGIDEYLEAKYIFKKLLKNNSKCLDDLSFKLVDDYNSIAVMVSRYMWMKNGKEYKDKYYKFSNASENSEIFFTFIDELENIVSNKDEKIYEGIEDLKRDFRFKAIDVVSSIDTNDSVFAETIIYLSLAEPDWFAQNWVQLYQEYKKAPCWSSENKEVAFRISIANNEKAQRRINELKGVIMESDYNFFIQSVMDNIERDNERWKAK